MSTITTKQLRENMSQVIDDLRRGNSVQLSYRHKVIGVLQPAQLVAVPLRRGTSEAINRGLEILENGRVPGGVRSDLRSLKEQLAEMRDRKYAR